MAKGDFSFYLPGQRGSRQHQVASGGTPPAINAGELVLKTLGNQYVIAFATNKPVVGTDYVVGLATGTPGSAGTSTESTTVAGVIEVIDFRNGDVFLGNPKVSTTATPQSTYNALVGKRVLIDVTSGVQTVLIADSSTSGCVIENLSLASYPGKIAFSIRAGASYLA